MGTGYTRQSAAEIQTGEVVEAAPLNAEFNQLQSAFDSTVGHTHDGTVGEGPKINLTNSVTGVLPVANGGSGGINKTNATTAPTAGDDSNDGYAVGSLWIDVTGDVFYVCVDATPTAAIWQRYTLYDAGLTSIAGLTTSANKMIYTTASDVYATTDLSVYGRTLIDDADASTAQSTLGISTYVKTLLDDVDASAAQTTLGISTYIKTLIDDADATTARATLGLTIGTNVQAQDTELQAIAGLVSAADRLPYFTGSGTASLATFTAAGRALVDDADATAQRATLGVVIGTDVQAQDAELQAIAGLTSSADKLPYFTGSGTAALTDLTSVARTLLDDTTTAAMLTTLGASAPTKTVQTFTANGTWTKPAGCKYVVVEGIGGGGGGAGIADINTAGSAAASAGGSSGFHGFTDPINVSAIASGAVVIGAAGAAGAAGANNGGTGGDTTITLGATTYTWGGAPGGVGTTSNVGDRISQLGGSPTGTNVLGSGRRGQIGMSSGANAFAQAGYGADSPYGTGGSAPRLVAGPAATAGNAPSAGAYGTGGSGAVSVGDASDQPGGAGAPGFMRVWEYY